MFWLSLSTTFCYLSTLLVLFHPNVIEKSWADAFKRANRMNPEMRWVILAMTLASFGLTIHFY